MLGQHVSLLYIRCHGGQGGGKTLLSQACLLPISGRMLDRFYFLFNIHRMKFDLQPDSWCHCVNSWSLCLLPAAHCNCTARPAPPAAMEIESLYFKSSGLSMIGLIGATAYLYLTVFSSLSTGNKNVMRSINCQ